MEISNLSSAWWLIAIVILVIITRVVLYYRAKAKRKDEMSKLFRDLNGSIINKPHVAPSGKVPDFIPPKPRQSYGFTKEKAERISNNTKDAYMQKSSDDYNADSMYVLSSSYATKDGYSNTVCKHVPENPNIILTSYPPQQKCKKCGKVYFI